MLDFNTEPYNDDYDELKQFYKVLFRPGYAVQARELTQLQTILQKQVTRFGDHVFKNGSMVIPGSVNVDNQVHFAKIDESFVGTNVLTFITQFRDKIVTGATSGVKARIIDTSECECVTKQKDIPTLYFKIEQSGTNDVKRFVPGEVLTALEADNQVSTNFMLTENQVGDLSVVVRQFADDGASPTTYSNDPVSDVLGLAYQVDIKAGIYYVDGYFVKNDDTHYYVGRFHNTPTARVGFRVVESTVSSDDDETLLDNAQGSYNFAAPGADRYKISLVADEQELQSSTSSKFIELIRIVDGRVQAKVDKSSYAELEKTLARRTFDESGNYEVNKFKLSVREHLDNGSNFGVYPELTGTPVEGVTYGDEDKFVVVVDPGKAYIEGYEVESIASQYVTLNKARENSTTGEENGHVVRLDDQPIGTPNGNYVIVKNAFKYPAINTFERVYLVKTLNVTPGSAPAATDIVGTAYAKSFELHSGDYTGGTNTEYKLGLLDVTMYSGYSFQHDVKQIVGTGTANVFTCDISPNLFTLSGSATSTTGSTTVTGVGTTFISDFKAGDVVYINGTRIGTVASNPTSNLSLTLTANGLAAVTGGQVSVFHAELLEPEYNSLIYKVGYQFVKTLRGWDGSADTVKSTQLTVRRVFSNATSTAGGSVSFELTSVNEFFLSDSDLSNYLLINNATNLPVNITTSAITFDNDSNRKVVTISGLSASTSYKLIASVLQINTAAQERTKTLTSDYAQTITGQRVLNNTVIELSKADVLRIKSIYMTPGDYTAFDNANKIDITDIYTLDDGQRSSYYTNAKLVLKPGYKVPSGAIKVTYDYFENSGSGNYFSVDSYVNIPYEDVPTYYVYDPSVGKTVQICLTCVLDFRPIIAGDNAWYPEISKIGTDVNAPVAYYVARQDKIVLDSVGRFNVISGIPSDYPQEPEDPKEGLVLATIYVPPYTKFVNDVKIYQRDNRRYTMKDIGKLDRRISNLEYYVALNSLEKDTETFQIKDEITGLDRFKNGFIVDQFTGHGVGDVMNEDYKVSVDPLTRTLRPMHFTSAVDVIEDLVSGTDRASVPYNKTGDLITLPYTESDFIFNIHASRTIDVNPYKIGAFKGEVTLIPEGDNWKDTERRPDLTVTDNNNYDAIRYMAEQLGVTGTVWNEWQTNWTGRSTSSTTYTSGDPSRRRQTVTAYEQTITTETGSTFREGISTSLQSSVNTQDYGDRVVDMSFIPYMRARPIVFIAKNLKTNSRFWAFFDNVDVNNYVVPADVFKVTRSSGASVMDFTQASLNNNILADDPKRAYNGKIEPAFMIGDVVTNSTHTATNITAITHLTSAAASFNMTLASTSGILPGHHVVLYNLNHHPATSVNSLYDDLNVPASTGLTSTTASSKELNLRKFKVTAVNGNTVTLANIDGTNISAFTAYSTASYSGTNRGQLLRLTASGVVAYDGAIYSSDANGVVQQDIYVLNIKNGFGIGETLTGTVNIGSTAVRNNVTLTAINGDSTIFNVPTMNVAGGTLRADVDGALVGTFFLPNNNSLAFRTGERTFKLIDNQSNSDADFDSKGSVVYYSQGINLSKERTIVNSRSASFAQDRLYESLPVRRTSTSNRVLYSYYTGHDPVAQTFTVSATGGCFVTSVDVFFSERGNRPVTVEIRSTNNGVPSTKVVPFTITTLAASELNVSDDGSVATTFKFQAPVYLQDGETYALVVRTDEPGCQLFVSELGKTDILTGNVITSQPLTGSIYLSQNSKEFLINPLLDMKFKLRKAVFDISSSIDVPLKATPPETYTLPSNPFEISKGTNKVRIYAPNHGFVAGDVAVIGGVASGNYGTALATTGIPHTLLNRPHTVLATGLDKDSFIIEIPLTDASGNSLLTGGVTTANFVKGEYGGSGVTCTRSLLVDSIYVKTSDLSFQDTAINYGVIAQELDASFATDYTPIVTNSNFDFTTRRQIKSYENQYVVTASPLIKKSSLLLKATLSSKNANVSPVIDLQKIAVYGISNSINNVTQSNINVAEIDSRNLLVATNITNADVTLAGTGTITATTGSTTVTGSGTAFLTQVKVGNVLKNTAGTTIGTVASVSTNTSLTLAANAAVAVTSGTYNIVAAATLNLSNSNGLGLIATNIDTADNLLANAEIGKYITITNAHSNVNGTYVVRNVVVNTDTTTLAGNSEQDIINVYVYPSFAGSASIDMITDSDFAITQLDKYVDDFAPRETSNYANYVTRTLSLSNPAEAIKVIFDASVVDKTDIKVYYRTWTGVQDLRKIPYVDTGYINAQTNATGVFTERMIDVNGIAPFTNVSIKIVMKSSDTTKVPLVKNLRLIAHS